MGLYAIILALDGGGVPRCDEDIKNNFENGKTVASNGQIMKAIEKAHDPKRR